MKKEDPISDILYRISKYATTRRKFLKWTGGIGAALGLSQIPLGGKIFPQRIAQAADYSQGGSWIYSCCNMCGGQSGIKVLVQDGVVKKIEPNDYNPIGIANISLDFKEEMKRGARLCPKGNSAVRSLYDPDRLKTPLLRGGKRGQGKWKSVSWEEALEKCAQELVKIRDRWGAESMIWFSEDHSFTHIQKDFCLAYGTPNYSIHSNLCDVARKASFKLVMGDQRPLADMQNAKYILLFGWNPLGAMKWAHLPAIINRARNRGAKLVVVDPIFSQTAAKADEWIPILPGTDGAMGLAIGHILIKENLYDKAFVEEWAYGFEEYKEYVKDKTPEWAEKITTVPKETIIRIARELAQNKPCAIDAWSGTGHHTNATLSGMALALIPVLLGQIDKPGTLMIPDRKGNKARSPLLEWGKPTAGRVDGLGSKYPLAHGSGIYCESRDAMISGQPYKLRAGVFVFQNFVMAVPNTAKNIEALKNLDFILVVDTHMSETADLADVVIPGSNFLERYDFTANWVTFKTLSLRQPAVKSWIGGMTEADFVMALARKMGFKGFDMSYEEYLSQEVKDGIGITLDELKALPGAVWIGGETSYEKFKSEVKLPEGGSIDEKGLAKDKDGKVIGFKQGEKILKGFNTPTRKLEFSSQLLVSKKLDPLPQYTDPEFKTSSEYPFYLVNWKQAEHTHTRTFNNDWLMEMKPDNPLWINASVGRRLELEEGDHIWIESAYGKAKGTVHLTEGIHPQVVGLQHGYGHWAFGEVAKEKGTADGQFYPGVAEKLSGQAVTKEVAVKIYKAKRRDR